MKKVLIVTVVAATLLASACGEKKAEAELIKPGSAPQKSNQITIAPDSPRLEQVKIEPVALAEVPANEVIAPGKIEANPNRISHVVLPVAGRVVAVLAKLGDPVQQGAPLLKVESPDADAAVSAVLQGQAAVAQAKSALLKAQGDLDRTRDLFEHNAIAKKELLNAESVAQQSRAALDQSEAALTQARRRTELLGLKPGQFGQQLTVNAPLCGKVLEISVASGEYRNDLSASLMTIADLSTVWIATDVAESDIRFVHMGERLEIEMSAFPGEKFSGRVTRMADTVDPVLRTVKVRAEMDNARGLLRPEMFARIRLVGGTTKLPVVPAGAVIQSEGSDVVYREMSRGVFEPVKVTLGERAGERVAIRYGLAPGDRVVTDGVMLLRGL